MFSQSSLYVTSPPTSQAKTCSLTMGPQNRQIPSPVMKRLFINSDRHDQNAHFLSEFCSLVPLPGLRFSEESQVFLFLLLLSRVNVFFFAMAVASFDVEFFPPCSLLSTSLITPGMVKGWPASIQRCGVLPAFPRKNA